jgi:hypothetical protein
VLHQAPNQQYSQLAPQPPSLPCYQAGRPHRNRVAAPAPYRVLNLTDDHRRSRPGNQLFDLLRNLPLGLPRNRAGSPPACPRASPAHNQPHSLRCNRYPLRRDGLPVSLHHAPLYSRRSDPRANRPHNQVLCRAVSQRGSPVPSLLYSQSHRQHLARAASPLVTRVHNRQGSQVGNRATNQAHYLPCNLADSPRGSRQHSQW